MLLTSTVLAGNFAGEYLREFRGKIGFVNIFSTNSLHAKPHSSFLMVEPTSNITAVNKVVKKIIDNNEGAVRRKLLAGLSCVSQTTHPLAIYLRHNAQSERGVQALHHKEKLALGR